MEEELTRSETSMETKKDLYESGSKNQTLQVLPQQDHSVTQLRTI